MNHKLTLVALLSTAALAAPSVAQQAATGCPATGCITSTSGSDANANSGSISGASSDNHNANINAGIGNSKSESNSNSTANSGSVSGAASVGNEQGQGQSQGQSANNTQGQGQDQGQGQSQANNADNSNSNAAEQGQVQEQSASNANSQGVTINQTSNVRNRKTTEVRTNSSVQLAASSSFSSDYCGGTVSGGGSASPIGITIGMSGPKYDKSCQSLRRAEKFGMAAVNYQNLGHPAEAAKMMSMMVWSICTADSGGAGADRTTANACEQVLRGTPHTMATVQPYATPQAVVPPVTPYAEPPVPGPERGMSSATVGTKTAGKQ